jgi:very-short-patch-repair endonuclease
MAAVLACGAGAVLSHRSAAYLWEMLKRIPGPVHVTLPTRAGRRKRRGITIHRSSTLLASQTTAEEGIPVTSPSRTLLDLRRIAPPAEYRRALRQAEFDGLPLELPTDGTRSELESLFLKLCRRHRLSAPEVNARLGPFLIDCLWRSERLAVELDGYASHSGRQAFEDDRRRDVWLKLHGYEVMRFTYEQVTQRPAEVAAAARALLQRRAAR